MLKLNIGVSKKVGESNYGSRGASVNLELELDSALVEQPDRLKERVRQIFSLAKTSVDDELNGTANGNGHATNGNGTARRNGTPRRSTASQVRALNTIADRQQVDLPKLLRDRFGFNEPSELSITEASQLIDELKSPTNGNGVRR
jgi:hypothetical protein